MRLHTFSSRSAGIGRAFFEAIAGVDESFVRDGGADTECGGRAQVRGGLHGPVQRADAAPAREGVLGRERHGLITAGAARDARGRIRSGGSGQQGMRGDG